MRRAFLVSLALLLSACSVSAQPNQQTTGDPPNAQATADAIIARAESTAAAIAQGQTAVNTAEAPIEAVQEPTTPLPAAPTSSSTTAAPAPTPSPMDTAAPPPTKKPVPTSTATPTPEPTNTPIPTPVPTKAPEPEVTVTMYVDAGSTAPPRVRLRTRPSTDSGILRLIDHGEAVAAVQRSVAGDDGDWRKVTYQGQTGYMAAEFLSPQKPKPIPTPTPVPTNTPTPEPTQTLYVDAADEGFTGVVVRDRPSRSGKEIGGYSNGDTVDVIGDPVAGDGRRWYKTEYEGRIGYVSARLLSETPPPPPTPTPAPLPKPIQLSGTGQEVTDPFYLRAPVNRIKFRHRGESNFIVHAFDPSGEEEYLVNVIGNYDGSVPLFGEGEWYLEVDADGPWTARIEAVPMASKPVLSLSGSGDYVSDAFMPSRTGPVPYAFTHSGESNFIVHLYCGDEADYVQNEIGPVENSAVARFAEGPCLWEVNADGEWSIAPK